jgi:hypothetical protein
LPAKALSFAHWSDARVAQEFTWKSATVTPNPGRAKLAVSYGHSIGELVMEHSDQQSLVGGKQDKS